ncbi:hypothetical protein AB0O75_43920 [Streptomyces sp. NPDC088921]|uniref:hypothetical protein n=1 Tax=unclassified Streptomyces TaxID=2593676 RepID=UPI0034313D8E
MTRVACEFPITVTITGDLSVAEVADLGRAVEEALAVRFRDVNAVHALNAVHVGARPRIRPQLPESIVLDPGPTQPTPELARDLERVLLRAVAQAVARLRTDELRAPDGSPVEASSRPADASSVPAAVPGGGPLVAFGLSEDAAEAVTAAPEIPALLPVVLRSSADTPPRGELRRPTAGLGPPPTRRHAPATRTSSAPPTRGNTRQPFRVRVTQAMEPPELLREFVRQYYQATSKAEVDRRMPWWHWTGERGRSVSAEEVRRPGYPGYVVLYITDVTQAAIETLPEAEREQINAEADARFWRESRLPPGTKLGTGPDDAARRARWRGLRADVVAEHLMRRTLAALPEDVRQILFAGDRPLDPADLETVLRLARKVSELTPAQRSDYLSKVAGEAASSAELDASIDRYLLAQREREVGAAQTEAAAASLFLCEDLYQLWQATGLARERVARAGRSLGPRQLDELSYAAARFDAALKRHEFADEQAFRDAIEAYRLRFRAEAVMLGLDLLARYDHLLYEERRKLQTPGYVETMVARIASTTARADLEAAAQKEEAASKAFLAVGDPKAATRYLAEADALRAAAGRAVAAGAAGDPLIDPEKLGRDTDVARLALLDAPAARTYLLALVEEWQADTAKVRQEFAEDPERVFSLPKLVEATQRSQGIANETIYAWIVDDHVKAVREAHVFSELAKGLVALLLAALVPFGGWVAAGALIAGSGLAVYQASEAIAEYQQAFAEHRLSFIQDKPSLFWVVVAVAGAALELGMTAAQLLNGAAKRLALLEKPLREFSTAAEVETATARYQTLVEKIDEVEGLQTELRDALKSHAAAELGLRRVIGEYAGRLNVSFLVDPAGPLKGMYYAVRKGVSTFEMLRADARMMELLGDVTKLTGAERAELTAAFKQVKQIVQVGKQRRMDEAMVLRYIDRLAAERSGSADAIEALLADMRAWRPPTPEQLKAEAELAKASEQWVSLSRRRDEVLAERMSRPKTPTGARDTERIAELDADLEWLEGETSRTGDRLAEGAIARAEQRLREAERLAVAARVSPTTRMRQVFNMSKERAMVAVSAKVDQVGTLRRSGALEVDHIVSLERMTQMDGFDLLSALERNRLAVREDNLVLMDATANASKGERSWAAWRQAAKYYTEADIARWRARDAELTARIQEWIRTTVRGRRPQHVAAGPRIAVPEPGIRIAGPQPLPAEQSEPLTVEPPVEEAPKKRLRAPRKPER